MLVKEHITTLERIKPIEDRRLGS